MRTRIYVALGHKSGLTANIDNNINEATLQVVFRQRPQEMCTSTTFSTADGDFDYTIASGGDIAVTDLYAIEMVRNETQNYRLEQGAYWEFEGQDQTGSDATGDPRKWFRRGNVLYLYNLVPDDSADTIRVSYLKRPTALSADADVFALNDEWVKPVETLATALTYLDMNMFDRAQVWNAAFNDLLGTRETPEQIEDENPDASFIMASNVDGGL
jgi:hypothetical protein